MASGFCSTLGVELVRADEQRGDDAHRLLRVVGPVTEAERRRRHQLQAPERAVDPPLLATAVNQPHHQDDQGEAEQQPEQRRVDDEHRRLLRRESMSTT